MSTKKKKAKAKKNYNLESFFQNNEQALFISTVIIFLFWAVMLFQLKISLGEDDSAYIMAAKNFLQGKTFPTWHGSFYPIFVALFIKIFGGINLTLLKTINIILDALQLVFLYYAFRRRVRSSLLILSLLFASVNVFLLIYSSLTYSEPLYMAIQAGMLWAFFALYDKIQQNVPFKKTITAWLWLGLAMFLLSITRNIGWAGIITVVLFFLLDKRWREAGLSIIAMLVFYLPYNLYKVSVWHIHKAGFEGQFNAIFMKNPYNPHLGHETFSGFINRFLINSKQYLSYHLINILGFTPPNRGSALLTIIVYIAFFYTLFILWKKKRELLLPILYIGIAVAVTFITQQTFWNQERLILIYVPIIVILLSSAIYEHLKNKKSYILAHIFLLLIIVLSFGRTIKYYKEYKPLKQSILAGNKFAGLTPDWKHYLQAVQYAAEHLPDSIHIACRKPGIAFINTNGREFTGIYKFPDANIDSVLVRLNMETAIEHRKFFAVEVPQTSNQLSKYYILYPYFTYLRAFINDYSVKKIFAFFTPDSTDTEQMQKIAQKNKLIYYTNIQELNQQIVIKNKSDYAVYPDTLMKFFITRHIDYLILARLRKIPTNKNAGIITTIQRFVNFMELKFPGSFVVVSRFGALNDEPAFLIKMNYQRNKQLIDKIKQQKNDK